jgi:hypothetical protein
VGTGRGLGKVKDKLELLEKFYLNLRQDLKRAGAFLNKKNLRALAAENKSFKAVEGMF